MTTDGVRESDAQRIASMCKYQLKLLCSFHIYDGAETVGLITVP
jgi:hypothetical protein